MAPRQPPSHLRGATLIEALVVMTLFAVGMAGLARLQTGIGVGTEAAWLRAEAVRTARSKLEDLRAYEQLPAMPAVTSFEDSVVTHAEGEFISVGSAELHLTWTAHADISPQFRPVVATVSWADRNGPQVLALPTVIARHPPDSVGRLQLPAAHETTTSLSPPVTP